MTPTEGDVWSSDVGEAAGQDRKSLWKEAEADSLVQGQGALVVSVGVDDGARQPLALHPCQRISDESETEALALSRRSDSKSLEVASAICSAGDGVSHQPSPCFVGAVVVSISGPRPVAGRGLARLVDSPDVDRPHIAERAPVDRSGQRPLAHSQPMGAQTAR